MLTGEEVQWDLLKKKINKIASLWMNLWFTHINAPTLDSISILFISIYRANRQKFPVIDGAIYVIYGAHALTKGSRPEVFVVSSSRPTELLVKTAQ